MNKELIKGINIGLNCIYNENNKIKLHKGLFKKLYGKRITNNEINEIETKISYLKII